MTYQTAPRPHAFVLDRARNLGTTNLFARLVAWFAARRGRAAIQRLAAFDDSMLSDIGLARSDLDAAASAPWDVDPTVVLAVRRRRRRQAEVAGSPAARDAAKR